MPRQHWLPSLSLLTGALVWGLIWFPMRALDAGGTDGLVASVATYFVALVAAGCELLWFRLRLHRQQLGILIGLGLAAALCNLGYVVATIHGEVMRVLLLFYLSPVWTAILARVLLRERLSVTGFLVMLLALAGAVLMLWQPGGALPLPASPAEWLGVAAGIGFALNNVLSRRAAAVPIQWRNFSIFAGCVVCGGALLPWLPNSAALHPSGDSVALIVLIGGCLYATNLVVQFGLAHTAANRAIVIFLSELIFAAISSWWLAGESMSLREWGGGALIILAALLSGRAEAAASETLPGTPARQTSG
jgi:drug/metabolite transporter (DMT)-like permease